MKMGHLERAIGRAVGNQEAQVIPVGFLVCPPHGIVGFLINHVLFITSSPELKISPAVEKCWLINLLIH